MTTGVLLPVLLGLLLGDPWGAFVIGGAVRLLVCYHATFSINSFAHLFGRQPYSNKDSSRDNFLTALISMGEGYHNFHHTFPADYRNGVRAYQFDPTKWTLRLLAAVGLARNLRRTPAPAILRARLRMDMLRLAPWLPPAARPHLEQLRAGIARAVERWHDMVARYELRKVQAGAQTRQALSELRKEVRAAGRDLRAACAFLAETRSLSGPGGHPPGRVRLPAPPAASKPSPSVFATGGRHNFLMVRRDCGR